MPYSRQRGCDSRVKQAISPHINRLSLPAKSVINFNNVSRQIATFQSLLGYTIAWQHISTYTVQVVLVLFFPQM